MSTGISISSINRIKELAEQKKFKEALEILDTQNLEKSINPQFLKISGEIFRENKRYYDGCKILLKAHQMAPQGTRIIQELIQLYLELGYFSKAQKYYEQYMFYVTPEDTQKDYVEYIMKKATGADVKDLAAILIPILERMPEDRWNFEAILLYHKMDRKDMALEESRYILENFKESEYVQPVIDYIDDKLDIDKWFYVYPKEEQPEDTELFADLIELEEKILEADHLRMYPPEARIMVEADDNDAMDAAPIKEKKPKKAKGLFKKNSKNAEDVVDGELGDDVVADEANSTSSHSKETSVDSGVGIASSASKEDSDKLPEDTKQESNQPSADDVELKTDGTSDNTTSEDKKNEKDGVSEEAAEESSQEAQVKQEREAALEKILSKKLDKDKIKESAKQVAKAVKEIDTDKAKSQVMSVATTVKDNVKKATDVIGEAVGTKMAADQIEDVVNNKVVPDEELIMDGIIEGVLEPPKKAVGEVVMNEELDAIIPDSLEAMSEKEIADREARKEEIERLELEALETTLKLEEEKKAKRQAILKFVNNETDGEEDAAAVESQAEPEEDADAVPSSELQENASVSSELEEEKSSSETQDNESIVTASNEEENVSNDEKSDSSSYAELKNRFMEEMEDDKPLESLGFMTVVHSDVDAAMEEAIPDAAGMLRQMIGNKEFYSGENSLGFESEASYLNHGFEVEDCDFDTYRQQLNAEQEETTSEVMSEDAVAIDDVEDTVSEEVVEETPAVQEIFAQENVVAFEEVAEEAVTEETVTEEDPVIAEESTVEEEPVYAEEKPVYAEEESAYVEEEPVYAQEEPVYAQEEPVVAEEPVFVEEVQEPVYEETVEEPVMENVIAEEPMVEELITEETVVEEPMVEEPVIEDMVTESPVFTEPPVFVYESVDATEPVFRETVTEEPVIVEEPVISEEPLFVEKPEVEEFIYEDRLVMEEPVFVEEPVIEEPMIGRENSMFEQERSMFVYDEMVPDKISGVETIVETELDLRAHMRANIILSSRMENILQELKGK